MKTAWNLCIENVVIEIEDDSSSDCDDPDSTPPCIDLEEDECVSGLLLEGDSDVGTCALSIDLDLEHAPTSSDGFQHPEALVGLWGESGCHLHGADTSSVDTESSRQEGESSSDGAMSESDCGGDGDAGAGPSVSVSHVCDKCAVLGVCTGCHRRLRVPVWR